MGADCSIAASTIGSLENVAVKAPIGLNEGVDNHTMSQGSSPRIAKTANKRPQIKNQRRARSPMVESTSALIMALSMLVMVSNKTRPAMIRIMEIKSIITVPISIVHKKIYAGFTGEN
jgi:hypothetical protein